MQEPQQYLSIRVPKWIVDRLDALTRQESDRTGLSVSRSAVVRRALEREVSNIEPATRKKGAK